MGVSREMAYQRYESGRLASVTGHVAAEALVRLHVNGRELAMLMCSPYQLDWLALGFLRNEGFIEGLADVRRIVICPSNACVEVWLHRVDFEPPAQRVITSGCGGGITFADLTAEAQPLVSDIVVSPRQLGRLMSMMQETQRKRGIHTAALAEVTGDEERVLAVVEDIGRHNTIDKLLGCCLSHGIETRDRIVLSTGRISSEMLNKVARMGAPVVVSRTSPTTLSVALAQAWNVTLVGYARRDSLNVYSGEARVIAEV
jgi:FdhD protein